MGGLPLYAPLSGFPAPEAHMGMAGTPWVPALPRRGAGPGERRPGGPSAPEGWRPNVSGAALLCRCFSRSDHLALHMKRHQN